jgi:hypothetical protein
MSNYLSAHRHLLDTGVLPPDLLLASNTAFQCAEAAYFMGRAYAFWLQDQTWRDGIQLVIPFADGVDAALTEVGPRILDLSQDLAGVRSGPYELPGEHLTNHPTSAHVAALHLAGELSEAVRRAHRGFSPIPKKVVILSRSDLIRLKSDIAFEAARLARSRPQVLTETPKAVHNADFTMVNWFGTEYHFATGVQAGAVRALWTEWEGSGLGLHQETIRQAIDEERDHFRMDHVFRNHPALGTMIQRAGDGRYKLAPPAQSAQPAPPAPQAEPIGHLAPKAPQKHV